MKIHILYTSSILDVLDDVVHFFTDLKDEVNILMPNQKTRIEKGDLLLLLDAQSINANTSAFLPDFDLPPITCTSFDHWFEYFRLYNFSYYKDKQRAKMLCIGHSALAIYGELGGKLGMGETTLLPMLSRVPNMDVTIVGDNFEFKWSKQIWGVSRFKFTQEFYAQICQFLGGGMPELVTGNEDMAPVAV